MIIGQRFFAVLKSLFNLYSALKLIILYNHIIILSWLNKSDIFPINQEKTAAITNPKVIAAVVNPQKLQY